MKNFIVNASRKVWQELIQNVNHYSYSLDSTVIVPMPKNNTQYLSITLPKRVNQKEKMFIKFA